jgi:UrcA family protein
MITQENLVRMSLASGITLALLIGVATAAAARDVTIIRERANPDVMTERVNFADLNLASRSDLRTLKVRVNGAVHRVCLPSNAYSTYDGCRYEAWSDARPQIARAVKRAKQIAATGTSTILPVAIVISVH